ncbi:MAG: NUDIX hydrolase [Burkholderiaceae bacterium]|nr:NUDIX hydrolase [Burkholderiaceae bacterium]
MTEHLREFELETDLVYEGIFLKVRRDRARMPDGSERGREYVVHPGAAAMVPLMADGRIVVERQFRYPLREVFVEIPAGKIDQGETALQTARRELIEETGFRAEQWALLTRIHPAIGFANEVIDIFLCRELVEVGRQLDHGEFVDLDFVRLGWLVDELRAGRLTDVKTQIAVHWLERIDSGQWPWPEFARP